MHHSNLCYLFVDMYFVDNNFADLFGFVEHFELVFVVDSELDYLYVFGSIHGDAGLFLRIKDLVDKLFKGENIILIFLGNYLENGYSDFLCIAAIMLLKIIFPNNVYNYHCIFFQM